MKNFDTFGIMLDCSRGAVYTVEALRRFIDLISGMDYNMLMLYTEDTYEIDGEPYFGYFRGRYTQSELKEIDAYALSKGVELIPCIQTLAHLGRIKDQSVYSDIFDTADILLADDERVYALIEKMFETCAECFTSRRINIGMDEAHMIGLGKYLDRHGFTNRYEILSRHLEKVCGIAKKYGFSPLMWSDMFFRFATGGDYRADSLVITDKERDMVPDGVGMIYWDYYTIRRARYDVMLENNKLLSDNVWFAGGIWTWTGFTPHNEASLRLASPAIGSCIEKGIRNAFFAMWGDGGAECSVFSVLPAMYYVSRLAHGECDDKKIKAGFKEKFGISYDDMTKLDLPDSVPSENTNPYNIFSYVKDPSKYMLYSDPFFGRYDSTVHFNESSIYEDYEKQLSALADIPGYGYLFRAASKLCKVLKYKYELGARTRRAYASGDKKTLKELLSDYDSAISAVTEFHDAFKAEWFTDKKPAGYEIHDIRLGGLEARLKTCRDRLSDFILGKLDTLGELDEKLLCCDGGGENFAGNPGCFNGYTHAASQSEF